MTFDVPEPGVYGLVRPDGELSLWHNRGRDSTSTWPIWDGIATPFRRAVNGVSVQAWQLFVVSAKLDHTWRPVRFGAVLVHREVDTRVWWTSARRSPQRRALYMPAMSRDALISLARDLEASSSTGVKETRKEPIGVWIRRVWDVIERRERGDTMGVIQ